jgi:hypothetical protein
LLQSSTTDEAHFPEIFFSPGRFHLSSLLGTLGNMCTDRKRWLSFVGVFGRRKFIWNADKYQIRGDAGNKNIHRYFDGHLVSFAELTYPPRNCFRSWR